jgi:hypothetical protein
MNTSVIKEDRAALFICEMTNLSVSGISLQFHSAKNKWRKRLVEKQGDPSRRADESNRVADGDF